LKKKNWLPCVEKVLKYYLGICMSLALGLTAGFMNKEYQGENIIFTTEQIYSKYIANSSWH
jgi:hypothetical protein